MIEKSSKLDNVRYEIRGPVLDEANRMIADGAKVLKLNIGNPAPFGFTTPEEIIRDMQMNLHDCEGYSDSKGIFSARKAIMQYCQLKKIPNVDVNDIYTGNGCSEMITLSLQAMLNHGDEILVPAPDYPLWTASVSLAGGTPVHYMCDEKSNWFPDLEDMERKITPKTKGIVVINPNNPTGVLYPKEILEGIADIARRHDLVLFADEIYDRLVFDGKKHVALASVYQHQRTFKISPYGGLPLRLDVFKRSEAERKKLYSGRKSAFLHASLLQRSRTVHNPDRARRHSERRRIASARRKTFRTA